MKFFSYSLSVITLFLSLVGCQEAEKKESQNNPDQKKVAKLLISVTEENFPTVYTDLRMNVICSNAGGTNKIMHMPVPPSDPKKQPVVRMNRDTYYSSVVFDLKDPAFITVPKTKKYASIQIVDENHETQPMIYGSGRHEITAKTRYAFVIIRSIDDEVRKNVTIDAGKSTSYIPKNWNMKEFTKLEKIGNASFLKGYDQSKAFGNKESGQTVHMNYVGAAGGWGGAMVQDNIYQASAYLDKDGCYEMTFKDPKDTAFWSVTVYNADGYMFNDLANISSNTDPVVNKDGTYTVRFGCSDKENNLPIREGNNTDKFNILVRHYLPSEMVKSDNPEYNPVNAIKKIN